MAGNVVSVMSMSTTTCRYMSPEARPMNFRDSVINNKDKQCPNCNTHFSTKTKPDKCPFCYYELRKYKKENKDI